MSLKFNTHSQVPGVKLLHCIFGLELFWQEILHTCRNYKETGLIIGEKSVNNCEFTAAIKLIVGL